MLKVVRELMLVFTSVNNPTFPFRLPPLPPQGGISKIRTPLCQGSEVHDLLKKMTSKQRNGYRTVPDFRSLSFLLRLSSPSPCSLNSVLLLIITYLITESEVVKGKSQTEALPYWSIRLGRGL